MVNISALVIAVIGDFIFPEPSSTWHPVAWLGKVLEFMKSKLTAAAFAPRTLVALGFLVALFFPLAAYLLTNYLIYAAAAYGNLALFLASSFFFWLAICFSDLIKRGLKIKQLLEANQLNEARMAAGEIVGRSLKGANKNEVTRAAVESLAENMVDGCLAPIFYGLIGGPPLAIAYRVINTLDSVFGYKSSKLLYLGLASAKLDDAANFIPARIFALMSSFLAPQGSFWHLLQQTFKDGLNHPSPNSGLAMAAVANCLNIKLGGLNDYLTYQVKVGPFNVNGEVILRTSVLAEEVKLLLTVYLIFLLFGLVLRGLLLL